MINSESLKKNIKDRLAELTTQIEFRGSVNLLDINVIAEDFFCGLINLVYGSKFVNANLFEQNIASIDLADIENRVAIQVTSNTSRKKVTDTIELFSKNNYQNKFDELKMLLLVKSKKFNPPDFELKKLKKFSYFSIGDIAKDIDEITELPKIKAISKYIDQEFKELFSISNEEVKSVLSDKTNSTIKSQITSNKYIPDLFIEIDNRKENVRYFSDPVLFYQKVVDTIERVNFSLFNKFLARYKIDPIEFNTPLHLQEEVSIKNVSSFSLELISYLKGVLNVVEEHEPEKLVDKIEQPLLYRFKQEKYTFGQPRRLKYLIEGLISDLEYILKRVLVVSSRAGQGKTNFLCDLVEKSLKQKKIPNVFSLANKIVTQTGNSILFQFVNVDQISSLDNLKQFFKVIDAIAVSKQAPFIIVIDGLNENNDLSNFIIEIEQLIETSLKLSPYVRFILSCRSEYLDARFNSFFSSSFSSDIKRMDNLHNHMGDFEKRHMFHTYMDYFNIKLRIYRAPYEQLTNDPLLLRIFSEAYQGGKTENNLGIIPNIYKETLFTKYFENKSSEIDKKNSSLKTGLSVGVKSKLINSMMTICEYMFSSQKFFSIPVGELLGKIPEDLFASIIDEDIFLRKDLEVSDEGLLGDDEVVSFTFDEFRDYLLSLYLVKLASQEVEKFKEYVEGINSHYTIFEGVTKFLFLLGRKKSHQGSDDILNLIIGLEWYEQVYINTFFEIPDEYIKSEDIVDLRRRFYQNGQQFTRIFWDLVIRTDTEQFKKLNIETLFEFLDKGNEVEKKFFTDHIYESYRNDYYRTNNAVEIGRIIEFVVSNINEDENVENSIELLLRFYKVYAYRVGKTVSKISQNREPLICKIIEKLKSEGVLSEQNYWSLMVNISNESESFPKNIYDQAKAKINQIDEESDGSLFSSLRSLILNLKEKFNDTLSEELEKKVELNTLGDFNLEDILRFIQEEDNVD